MLAPASQWPFQLYSETVAQFDERLAEYRTLLIDAGMTLFIEFVLIAMAPFAWRLCCPPR